MRLLVSENFEFSNFPRVVQKIIKCNYFQVFAKLIITLV